MAEGEHTFTALAVSSVNGGKIPEITAITERPSKKKLARTIDFFAP